MKKEVIIIRFDTPGLGGRLSNLYPYEFIIDDVNYACMEAFFSCLRTPDQRQKNFMRDKHGHLVYSLGHRFDWKPKQEVYYLGNSINRHSVEYYTLITRAFDALFENVDFQKALKESSGYRLTHPVGKTKTEETLLTRREFIGQLERLLERLTFVGIKSLFNFD